MMRRDARVFKTLSIFVLLLNIGVVCISAMKSWPYASPAYHKLYGASVLALVTILAGQIHLQKLLGVLLEDPALEDPGRRLKLTRVSVLASTTITLLAIVVMLMDGVTGSIVDHFVSGR
jgi:hypothetical protein